MGPSDASLQVENDFDYLCTFLPKGWEQQAKVMGALRRCRKIPDSRILLRILLIHLAEGCSLRETALRAREGNLIDLSDVAIMDRLRSAGQWFRWMNAAMVSTWVHLPPSAIYGSNYRVRVVDGSRIKEPGPTGSSWCLHYAIDLPSLACSQIIISDASGCGETFKRFEVRSGELMIGDRVYGVLPGIEHVTKHGAEVLVRFGWNLLPLWESPGKKFALFPKLRTLRGTRIGDWPVLFQSSSGFHPGRVCAIKKSRQATEKARQKAKQKSQKQGSQVQPETLEAAGYVFVFTTVPAAELPPSKVLEMYRGRWQIELVFKRLKSILSLGHLRKVDSTSAQSWLQGKLLVALLMEALLRKGEAFFPWGFPIS